VAKLTLIVQSSASSQKRSLDALTFARSALKQGHEISCLFFYRDAVDHALAATPAANKDVIEAWTEFREQYNIPLVVCHTVAERVGIDEFHPSFDATGLTALSKAMATSDRTLQF
jgi:tRNA 2-thiouridine synthesizing protein D